MAGSRGQKCSWIEMQRVAKQVLPALENGDGKRYAEMRCVDASTVSRWKLSAQVLSAIEDHGIAVVQFEHLQPTHVQVIGRAFKKLHPWNEDSIAEILDCVDKCEDGKLTAKEISDYAKERAWRLSGGKKRRRTAKPATVRWSVLLCDPPWRYDFAETSSREIENQYPTMTVEELCKLQVPAEEDSVMFLWATAPKLIEALDVLKAWGFDYKTNAVWDKKVLGMGYWFRGQHELLLVGVRGEFSPPPDHLRVSSVIEAKRGQHSEKPAKVYELIRSWYPEATRVDLFARDTHPGWDAWGNEVVES